MGGCISEKSGGKLQLCSGAGVSLPAWLALSSGQEAPTVSAVSLTANEFPGGGVYVCVCAFDRCLHLWGNKHCMDERERAKTEKGCSHHGALGTPVHPVLGPHSRKSCFRNAATAASAHSAVTGGSLRCAETTERVKD